jgi:hypothetical protein
MHRFLVLCSIVLVSCSQLPGFARAAGSSTEVYPLDATPRAVQDGEELPCQRGDIELVTYKGEIIRYARPLRVHPSFQAQLLEFERIVAEVGQRHFGRAPRRIEHFGAYACRPMRRHAHRLSEHALGNAIDVAGFEFGPATRKMQLPPELPRPLRRAFTVRVDRHWEPGQKAAAQSAFLRELSAQLIARPDVFRAIVGPGWPGHDNHFHLAHPPYRMVKVGEELRWFW